MVSHGTSTADGWTEGDQEDRKHWMEKARARSKWLARTTEIRHRDNHGRKRR